MLSLKSAPRTWLDDCLGLHVDLQRSSARCGTTRTIIRTAPSTTRTPMALDKVRPLHANHPFILKTLNVTDINCLYQQVLKDP